MTISITAQTVLPDRRSFEPMMADYYTLMVGKFRTAGGPEVATDGLVDGVWQDIDAYLPPNGQLVLAHEADGTLVGCGFLKKIRDDAGELKRLYVLPRMQGQGLGRRLIEARITAAHEMGLTDLYADTVAGNRGMLSLYDQLGFKLIDRYPENANPPEWSQWLVYLHRPVDMS